MSFVLMRLQNGCCCSSSYYYYHHSHYRRHHRRHHNHHLDHHQGHYHHRHGDCCCCCSGKYVNVMLRLRHLDLGRHWRDLMKTRDSQHDGMMIMLAGDGDGGGGLGGHELCCCCCSIFQLSPLCPHVRFPVYSMPLCMTDVCVCVFRFLGCLAAITLALGVPFGKHAVVHCPQPGYSITRSVLGCMLASAPALRNGMCRKYLMPFSILCFRVYALIMGYWIL